MEFEKSSIERLKRTLYSRNENVVPKERRTPVAPKQVDVSTDWGTQPSFGVTNEMTKKTNSFFNKFLVGSLFFFLIALGIAAFIFFGGMNMVSSNNLEIRVLAPSTISSGEELSVALSIVNNNRTDLEQVVFFVDYPEGAVSIGENDPLTREKTDLGIIKSGESKDHTLRAVLSGEKEAIKKFNFRIEYKIKGSNATFSKEKTFEVVISSSPIILNVSAPRDVNSGQDVTLTLDLVSNSSIVIKNSLVKIEYPYGFTYKSSNVKPLRDDSVWSMGDLKEGDKKTLTIIGTLVGQNLEDRSFKISAGTENPETLADFDVALATNVTTIGIRKSSFDLSVDFTTAFSLGESVPVTINWQNILPERILNIQIEAVLSGNVFDRAGVYVGANGYYRSVDNTIVWDKNTAKKLASLSPGDFGSVSFSVISLPNVGATRQIKNPFIKVTIKALGDRSGTEAGELSSEETITIKYPSNVVFSTKNTRMGGAFSNSGSIPPKADKETTYTITWTLTNANNDLKDVLVTSALPSWVVWKSEISPLGEKITFNPETRILSWNVGNLSLGTGFTNSPKEVSFKIGIIPSVNQIGIAPNLVTDINISAKDTFSESNINLKSSDITTQFSDSTYKLGDNLVQK